MGHPYFFADHEHELHTLIRDPDHKNLNHQLRRAACHGIDPDVFHPDHDRPEDIVIALCITCEARLACLALALRTENPDARSGWYGGLGPEDRDDVATALDLVTPEPSIPNTTIHATQLRASGWTVNAIASELNCSRRTVQRHLRSANDLRAVPITH